MTKDTQTGIYNMRYSVLVRGVMDRKARGYGPNKVRKDGVMNLLRKFCKGGTIDQIRSARDGLWT